MSAGDWKDMFDAACSGDLGLLRFHLESGVDPDYAHPEYQSTALVACLLAGQQAAAHVLLDHGADAELYSPFDELTPIDAARQQAMDPMVDRLRAAGARLS